MTAEQLLGYDARGQRAELVRGRLVVREPAGYLHGAVAARVLARIASFLLTDQLARGAEHPLGEVLAPGNSPGEVLAKVADWLSAGTALVWVIDPATRVARVYRADGTETILQEPAALEGEAVLPGFTALLADILR